MSGWLRHLALTAKAKTGFSPHIVVWAVIAAIASAAMVFFLSVAAFVWLAERYDALIASLMMTAFYFVVTLIAVICIFWTRRRTIEQARIELAARSNAHWLDPRLMAIGFQVGRAIGWRKLAALGAVGILAAGLTKEWLGRDETPPEGDERRFEN
jgi:hypothetical protein